MSLSNLGVITAQFSAAWPVKGTPPPDEKNNKRAVRPDSIGFGETIERRFNVLERRYGNVRALVFAGTRLVSGGDDRSVRLWDVDAGKESARAGHAGAVMSLAASADGRRAFSGGADFTVREWNLPVK